MPGRLPSCSSLPGNAAGAAIYGKIVQLPLSGVAEHLGISMMPSGLAET